jgi:hypothetical protein
MKKIRKTFPHRTRVIEHAFSIAGTDYFRFDDLFNLPYERGMTAFDIYEESRMRCTREYLEKHVEILRGLSTSEKPDVFKINKLNELLEKNIRFDLSEELLYKIASVVFFDKNENPELYDEEYCRKKIEFWKKHKGVSEYFRQKSLRELIPFLKSAGTIEMLDLYR